MTSCAPYISLTWCTLLMRPAWWHDDMVAWWHGSTVTWWQCWLLKMNLRNPIKLLDPWPQRNMAHSNTLKGTFTETVHIWLTTKPHNQDNATTWWHDDMMARWHHARSIWIRLGSQSSCAQHNDVATTWHDDMMAWRHNGIMCALYKSDLVRIPHVLSMVTWWHDGNAGCDECICGIRLNSETMP